MKLLYCKRCHDIIKLSQRLKTCDCGNVKGMYSTERQAQFVGEFAVPLGIQNSSFERAVNQQPKTNNEDGESEATFEAFVIPEICPTLERIG